MSSSSNLINQKISKDIETQLHLQKDFKVQVSLNDFIGRKDTQSKNTKRY